MANPLTEGFFRVYKTTYEHDLKQNWYPSSTDFLSNPPQLSVDDASIVTAKMSYEHSSLTNKSEVCKANVDHPDRPTLIVIPSPITSNPAHCSLNLPPKNGFTKKEKYRKSQAVAEALQDLLDRSSVAYRDPTLRQPEED
eukprot:TRINITY_DN12552_c0_g1_i1.p1 TRINITY_DN12552_c0_g1~~TRINITY_DN12552_c0_g1_i1.p1  ORF type:complete len:147 (-),score=28.77 TRINITY_DN12552_c0_g1_i1:95-514(-)